MEITEVAVEVALSGTTRFTTPITGPSGGGREGAPVRVGPFDVHVDSTESGSGVVHHAVVRNPSTRAYSLRRVGFRIPAMPRLVLETGYQSWSPVRRCAPGDIRPLRRIQPLMARGSYHADPSRAGHVVAGDQYLVWTGDDSGGVACFLDARHHLSSVEAPSGRFAGATSHQAGGLWAWALLDRLVLDPGSETVLDPLWVAAGDPGRLYSEAADLWSSTAGARPQRPSPAPPSKPGWCSWYQYWWKVAPADVRRNAAIAAERGLGLVVLDDGYQSAVGDWLTPNARWSTPGSTPSDIAAEISKAGMIPGIWTAPFFVGRKSRVADHPEWIVRAAKGAFPLPVMYNPVGWGGLVWALDTTQEAVLDHLRTTYAGLREQGYDFFKVDFCYGATMPGRRQADGLRTRAQALRDGLQAVRDGIGDDAYLLGCGCPFGPAVGIVDAMRVSPDVAPYWKATLRWPAYPDAAPAAVNAVRASVLRAPLHRRLFANDPDCAVLRTVDTKLTAPERQVLSDVIAGTGGFTLLSDDLSTYSAAEWETVQSYVRIGDGLDGPLDVEDPFARAVTVRSAAATLDVDWGEPPGSPLNPPGWRIPGAARPIDGSGGGNGQSPRLPGDAPWSRLTPA